VIFGENCLLCPWNDVLIFLNDKSGTCLMPLCYWNDVSMFLNVSLLISADSAICEIINDTIMQNVGINGL
jgi:hypothetical protein